MEFEGEQFHENGHELVCTCVECIELTRQEGATPRQVKFTYDELGSDAQYIVSRFRSYPVEVRLAAGQKLLDQINADLLIKKITEIK
jgi:hypothetical protein